MKLRHIMSSVNRSESKKAESIRFIITGGFATAVQYGLYLLFVTLCSIPAAVAAIVSYGISFLANFVISNYYTFHTRPTKKKMATFSASHLINLSMQTILVQVFSGWIGPGLALLPAMMICVPCNFFMVRYALKKKNKGANPT